MNGSALLKGLSHRQNKRLDVDLTVNGRDKVLKSTAVQRQSMRPLPLLVLLNSLQDQLFLMRENKNWHYWMLIHCLCIQSHAWQHMWGRHEPPNMCAQVLSQSYAYYLWSSTVDTHACTSLSSYLRILLPLSLGSLHLACAPNPQKGEWKTLQRWSGHLDFSLAAAKEGLCSLWILWPQEGADAQNTTLLCCT